MITYNQQPGMPTKSSTSLMPCPFCGEIVTLEYYDAVPKSCKDDECIECGCCDYCDEFWAITHVCEPRISFDVITDTSDEAIESWNNAIQEEAEAIAAWNTRAVCREYILRVPLGIEQERFKYINEQATSFLGYPILEEVVRCRDCRYRDCTNTQEVNVDYCARLDMYVVPDGFCAWGERREE